eukprot:5733779-Amphidinium_carterae.1
MVRDLRPASQQWLRSTTQSERGVPKGTEHTPCTPFADVSWLCDRQYHSNKIVDNCLQPCLKPPWRPTGTMKRDLKFILPRFLSVLLARKSYRLNKRGQEAPPPKTIKIDCLVCSGRKDGRRDLQLMRCGPARWSTQWQLIHQITWHSWGSTSLMVSASTLELSRHDL